MATDIEIELSQKLDQTMNENSRLKEIVSKASDFITYMSELDSLQTEELQYEFDDIVAELNSVLSI